MTEEDNFEIKLDTADPPQDGPIQQKAEVVDDDAMTDVPTATAEPTISEQAQQDAGVLSQLRLDTLHISGVDNLSSEQIRKYIRTYSKIRRFTLEWVNDTSLNVNFFQPKVALQALQHLAVTPAVPNVEGLEAAAIAAQPIPVPPPPSAIDAQGDPVDAQLLAPQQHEYNTLVHAISTIATFASHGYDLAAAINDGTVQEISRFFLVERLAVEYSSQQLDGTSNSNENGGNRAYMAELKIRYAVKSDTKERGARQKSRYYLVHGEPSLEDDLITFGDIKRYDYEEIAKREQQQEERNLVDEVDEQSNGGDILSSKVLKRLEAKGYKNKPQGTLGVGEAQDPAEAKQGDDGEMDTREDGASQGDGTRSAGNLFDRIERAPGARDRRGGRKVDTGASTRLFVRDIGDIRRRAEEPREPSRRRRARSRSRSRSPERSRSPVRGGRGDGWRYDGQRREAPSLTSDRDSKYDYERQRSRKTWEQGEWKADEGSWKHDLHESRARRRSRDAKDAEGSSEYKSFADRLSVGRNSESHGHDDGRRDRRKYDR